MAKNEKIQIDLTATDRATPVLNQVEQSTKRLGATTKSTADQVNAAWTDNAAKLDALGSRYRYLSLATGIVTAASIGMIKSFVQSAREIEQAQLKLGVFAVSAGEDMNAVNDSAMNLASTGLISVEDASTSLANLLATGLGLEKSTKLLDTFLNSAIVAKESINDTYGDAVVKASTGVRIFQERQIDAIGINTQLNKVFQEYAKEVGVVSTNLTNAQKYQAIYNFYTKEGERTTGAVALAMDTFSGALSRLGTSTKIMQARLGNALIPVIGTLADVLYKGTVKLGNFAKQFPEFTSIVLVGSAVVLTLVTAFATLGAIVPMITRGFTILNGAMIALTVQGLGMMLSKFAIAAVVIGGLAYAVIQLTGGWTKWTDAMKNLSTNIANTIKPMSQMDDQMEETNKKLARQLSDIKENIMMTTRDFEEGLAQWVVDHDKSVTKIRTQISDLARDYQEKTNDIKKSFTSLSSDLEIEHARTVEDLQQQLDEEISKGVWADQTRIRDLQKALKRENEDYARAKDKNATSRDEDLAEEKDVYDSKLAELQEELKKEEELEKKHAAIISKYRTYPILDEIDLRLRAYTERMQQYSKEISRAQEDSAAQIAAIEDIGAAYDDLAEKSLNTGNIQHGEIDDTGRQLSLLAGQISGTIGLLVGIPAVMAIAKSAIAGTAVIGMSLFTAFGAAVLLALAGVTIASDKYRTSFENMTNSFDDWNLSLQGQQTQLERLYKTGQISNDEFKKGLLKIIDAQKALSNSQETYFNTTLPNWVRSTVSLFEKVKSSVSNVMSGYAAARSGISTVGSGGYSFASGGVVPGSPSTAVQATVHGGETILPAGVQPVTININNPSVRNDMDIQKIAEAVKQVITTDTKYRRFR